MKRTNDSRLTYILLALLITFLWATSWVLIKWGLSEFPPITFAGIRYFGAFLCLLPFVLRKKQRKEISRLKKSNWISLILLGFLYYTLTQGAQFTGLSVMPAMAVSLILSFTSIFVAGIGVWTLGEKPTLLQWTGLAMNVLGACLYFYPVQFSGDQFIAIGIVFLGMLGNSVSTIIGRKINKEDYLSPVGVTTISMGFGSLLLLAAGFALEDLPPVRAQNWFIVVWMAVVNTALAFTLWNTVLKKMKAMEASIINNTITVQIAVLAWVLLGERLNAIEIVGTVLAVLGAVLVQLGGMKSID